MTNAELQQSSGMRTVDQITVVTDDMERVTDYLSRLFHFGIWNCGLEDQDQGPDLRRDGQKIPYVLLTGSIVTRTGLTLRVVQPVEGDTIYREFLDRFGAGIMGVRERLTPGQEETYLKRMKSMNVKPAQEDGKSGEIWFDAMDSLGAVFSAVVNDRPMIAQPEGRKICQICMVTKDVESTARTLTDCLGLSPWEIGHCNNHTMAGMRAGEWDASNFPKSEFLAGIGMYGGLQFEVIQPVEGPLPYFGFLDRRGIGFHHIKEELTPTEYDADMDRYRKLGVVLEGRIGPCGCCNLNTEDKLGFVYEFSDGREMDQLPEGYNAYMI